MTWQDELQKLDNELASGRISADDYRRRRDEVLSGSAGGGPAQNPQSGPFAPPFKWEAQPPSTQQPPNTQQPPSTADRTQVVNVQGAPPQQQQQPHNPDATQVVAGRPPADADRTQFVAPVQQQGGWGQQHQQQQAAPPPWVGGDFDSINQPSPSWSHGPEVFDESGGGGKGRVFAIVGVVLVLALIGGGIWWFTSGSKSSTETPIANSQTNPPTTSSSAGPKLPGNTLPGKVDEANSGKTTVEQASKERTQFSPDEAALMTTCGAEDGMSQVTYADDWVTQIHVFKCSDEAAAKAALEPLMEKQRSWGFGATTGPQDLPAMLHEKATDVPEAPFDTRIFYASKDTLVRLEVRGKTKESMEGGITKVVAAVAKNYPIK